MKTIVLTKIVDGEINPFDQSALEVALSISDNHITLVCMGPKSWSDILREVTRLGVERVILLSDPAFAGSDTLATSYILSKAIEKLDYDLILCGRKTLDGETAQVGPCLSAMLKIPVITNAFKLDTDKSDVHCKTNIGNESCTMPALISVEKIKPLRFPSIFSKLGDVEIWSNAVINADIKRCGLNGSPTKVIESFESVKGERNCKIIPSSDFIPLIKKLLEKDKKERIIKKSDIKIKTAWAIGEEVLENATAIAENVVLIKKTFPEEIAKKAISEKPDVILWNSDAWGRRNAPIVQALLNTGLCADCIELETDGKNLFMIRPAKAGNITAKIRCDTSPQMATVRTTALVDSDIILSAGKGVSEKLEEIRQLADKLKAKLCASRGLVDMGKIEYEAQVGLTGKVVNPKIYIAIGISGAVHHTVGISDADTVIAVNPDKNARIFEYADYGIVADFDDFLKNIY